MEADGEGMVAIIEGLQDSAIAITVMNSRRKPCGRRSFEVPMSKWSVETSTDFIDKVNQSAQICDGRYASSYQLAHCNKIPTSPAVVVPEFPPQRAEPCRTHGNFKLGVCGNGESYHSTGPFSPQHSIRNGYILSNSGASVHHSRSTRMDAFAHSLRRYPCLSPDKNISTEYIQRLITYAQTKHHSKNSCQSKSMRSLPYERSEEIKSTRHVQKNLRTDYETSTKDNNYDTSQINGRSKSKNITSDLENNERNARYKDSILNETYDYLKSNIPRGFSKTTEVRTMTKFFKETLKQIYNSKNMALRVCPEVKKRYDRHMKQHHSSSMETTQPKPESSSKTCFCNKPSPCNCEEGTSKLKNIQQSGLPSKVNFFVEDEDKEFGKRIEDEIYEWLREVPVNPNETPEAKSTRITRIKQLSDTLKGLNDDEFSKRCRDEINKCIDSLPILYPSDKHGQDKLKEQLADKLLVKLNRVPKRKKFTDEVSSFVNNIPLKAIDTNGRAVNKDNIRDTLGDSPPNDNDYKAEMRAELLDTLEEILTNVDGDRKKELNNIAKLLVSTLLQPSPEDIPQTNIPKVRKVSASSMENTLQRKILEFFNDTPEILNDSISDKKDKIKKLENILQKYKQYDLNDKIVQSRIENDIKDWLESIGPFDSTSKDKMSRRLLQKIISSDALKYSELDNTSSDIHQSISDWFDNIPEISGSSKNEKKKLVHSLANKLLGLHDDNNIRNEIHDWLSETLNEKGEHFKIKEIDDLVEGLVREIKNVPRGNVSKKLENWPDSNKNKSGNKTHEKIRQFQNSKDNLVQKFYDDARVGSQDGQPESKNINKNKQKLNSRKRWDKNNDLPNSIQREISLIIDQEHTELSNSKKQDLKDKIANVLAKSISNKPGQSEADSKYLPEKMRAQSNLKQHVRDEVSDILKKVNISSEYQDEIAERISSALEKEISSGTVSDTTEEDILNILLDSDIPEEQAENMTSELLKKANEMALVMVRDAPTKTSRRSKFEGKSILTPAIDIETEAFKNIAEKEILDLLAKVTGEDSVELRNKRKRHICELLCGIGVIIYDLNLPEEDKINEVMKCLRKISLPSGVTKERFASEVINRIRNLTSENSKNIHRKKDTGVYFHPEAESTRLSVAASDLADQDDNRYTLREDYQDKNIDIPKKKRTADLEKEIMDKFSYIIKEWIDELPIDLNRAEDEGFKKMIVKDLAGDVIDRLKYLQLNPDLKSTDREELEHLKYQVFRWLNKLLSADNLNPILTETQVLMDRLKQVNIPQLVQPSGRRKESKLIQGGTPNYTDAVQDEISKWLEELPPHLVKFSDSRNHKQIVKKLADIIQQQRDNTNIYSNREIEQCLNEVVTDKQKINKIAESLKNRLILKNLMGDISWMPVQNTSQFIEENLQESMMDWLKDPPLYQQRIPEEKIIQKELIKPRPSDELFTEVVEDWLNSIPVNPRSSITEVNLFAAKKKEFMMRLKELRQQHNSLNNNDQMSKEIKEYLLLLPIDASKKLDQKFLNDKVEELLKSLQVVPREQVFDREPRKGARKDQILGINEDLPLKGLDDTYSKSGYKKPADMLYDNIENWCKDLPIYLGNSPADIEKVETIRQNIASRLINKVGELNMNPEIFKDDLLYEDLLQDEADNLLSSIPKNPELESNLPRLIKNLTVKVKEANQIARNELTGQLYKQQLKDSISKTLPVPSNLSSEEEASFEVLKDCVADAFINLHYVGNEEKLKNKFQMKIKDEVSKFCSDFMKRYPNRSINNEILNRDLYNALCNVTLPNEEAMKSEVGEARIKDAMNDWAKDLPLEEQSEADQLQQRKIVSILAKKIHDMEKEESFHPDISNDEKKQKEIVKWIKKLPLKPGNYNFNKMAAKLVNDFNNTEKSRRFSGLSMRSNLTDSFEKNTLYNNYLNNLQIPPSTLSQEEIAHLQRIRVRTPLVCKPQRNCMDAAFSPCPVDSCTQTQTRPWGKIICKGQNSSKYFGRTQKTKASDLSMQSDNNYDVSPKVIIKEYHWDSTEGSKLSGQQMQQHPIGPDPNHSRNYVRPVIPSSVCKQNVGLSCPSMRNTCTSFEPCVTPRSPIQNAGTCMSYQKMPCTSTPKRPGMRRKRDPFPQPSYIEHSGNSTGIEEECTYRRHRPRPLINSVRFSEEDDFLEARVSPIASDDELETMAREDKRNHEQVRYKCRENTNTKFSCRRNQTCPRIYGNDPTRNCSRCSVSYRCPNPSFLYFRK